VGVAGGKGVGLLFKHGEIVRKFDEKELADVLVREVENIIRQQRTDDRAQTKK